MMRELECYVAGKDATESELRQFINIALGSLSELRYLLSFALRLKYLDKEKYNKLEQSASGVGKSIWKFYKSL